MQKNSSKPGFLQHLICEGTDFIFETVDQTQLDKFEHCLELIGGRVRKR